MSHEQFPAFRLAALVMRQISSPIARRIAAHAKSHPRFSRTACVRACEWYRGVEWRVRAAALRAAGCGGLRGPPAPLPLTQATDMGADIIGEAILFILGAAILIFEVNRQANVKEAKEEEERNSWLGVVALVDEMDRQLREQQTRIDALRELLLQVMAEQDAENKETGIVTTEAVSPKAGSEAESPKNGAEAERPKVGAERERPKVGTEAEGPKDGTEAERPTAGSEAESAKAGTEAGSPKTIEMEVDLLDELPTPSPEDHFAQQALKEKHGRCKRECCCSD